jgi:hypothetical protein
VPDSFDGDVSLVVLVVPDSLVRDVSLVVLVVPDSFCGYVSLVVLVVPASLVRDVLLVVLVVSDASFPMLLNAKKRSPLLALMTLNGSLRKIGRPKSASMPVTNVIKSVKVISGQSYSAALNFSRFLGRLGATACLGKNSMDLDLKWNLCVLSFSLTIVIHTSEAAASAPTYLQQKHSFWQIAWWIRYAVLYCYDEIK